MKSHTNGSIVVHLNYTDLQRPHVGPMTINCKPESTQDLKGVASTLWSAALAIRQSLLVGPIAPTVIVTSHVDQQADDVLNLMRSLQPSFSFVQDRHKYAQFDEWCVSTPQFMRLATLKKVLPELEACMDYSRLMFPENREQLLWTAWLGNHHVNFQNNW